MANIIVTIACNIIAALILLSCIFSAKGNGLLVSGFKLIFTIIGGVAAYFLTPVLASKIMGVAAEGVTIGAIITNLGISTLTLKSILFLVVFMVLYLLNIASCSIIKHFKIKALRNKKQNTAKIKRAKSINPRAEKAAKKSAWKALKAEYKAKNTLVKRIFSCIFGFIGGLIIGFAVLMPYGYIAKDLVAIDNNKEYLVTGYENTINGLLGNTVSDWVLQAE